MITVIKEPSVIWYKDRDFPEIKSSNSDIVAVIEDPNQLKRVLEEHNDLVYQLDACFADIKALTRFMDDNKKLRSTLTLALGVVEAAKKVDDAFSNPASPLSQPLCDLANALYAFDQLNTSGVSGTLPVSNGGDSKP